MTTINPSTNFSAPNLSSAEEPVFIHDGHQFDLTRLEHLPALRVRENIDLKSLTPIALPVPMHVGKDLDLRALKDAL